MFLEEHEIKGDVMALERAEDGEIMKNPEGRPSGASIDRIFNHEAQQAAPTKKRILF